MIIDYPSLQSTLADYLGRSDLTTQIQTFINQGESRIYRDLRVRAMEESLTGALTAGSNLFPLPADYLEMKAFRVITTGYVALRPVTSDWLYYTYPQTTAMGPPVYFARDGQNLVLAPFPDSTYTVAGVYYGRLPSLSNTNTTNWLTANNPDLIMAAAMQEACGYLMDQSGLQYWQSRYQQIAQQVQDADRRENASGGPLAMRSA